MTQDEIIRMALEAGLGEPVNHDQWDADLPRLERFAALVAAHEREKQAEPSQLADASLKPVAYVLWDYNNVPSLQWEKPNDGVFNGLYYAAPVRTKDPCNPLQDLTDDEIISALGADMDTDEDKECFIEIVRLGIAAYKEKNK